MPLHQENLHSDHELLKLVAQGDMHAFQQVFETYWDKVYATGLRLTKTPEQAKDLSQDIFLKVWDNRAKLPEVKNFRSYLYSITKNLIHDQIRTMIFRESNKEFLISYFTYNESSPQEILYVADFGNNRVQRFPAGSTGATNGATIAGGNGVGAAANQFDFPDGLAVDAQGNVYVDDQINERIQEWAPGSTAGVTIAGGNGQGSGTTQFDQPRGIYVDTAGAIYIADSFNDRVQKWSRQYGIDTSYFPSEPGSYIAVVLDSAGCTMTSNPVTISPASSSSLTIVASSTDICAGDTVIFTANPVHGGNTPAYQWLVNGNKTGSNSTGFASATLANGDIVNCMLTSSETCLSMVSGNPIDITVRPAPLVNAGNDTVLAPGSSILLHALVGDSILAYRWTPVTGLSDPSKPDPLAAPVSTTTYQLSVLARDGCQGSGKITITVYYNLHMPNAFTPNGDGRNDVFRIPAVTAQRIRSFSVYNRRGIRVFRTMDSGMGWDGEFQHQKEPAGTYVWEIEYIDQLSGKSLRAHGTVVLVR